MMNVERRNLVRAAMLADRRDPSGKEAWRKALRALLHEQQQLRRDTRATEVMGALVAGHLHMIVTDADEDRAARMVIGLLQLEW